MGIELDIVIPDVKTLDKDPKKTLLICIPMSSDIKIIKEKISQLEKIQSIKENIWLVLSKEVPITQKSFILSKENNSFSKIIFEIAQFSNVHGTSKFKILRI
jgi:CRISPR/Cas system CMR-associated protein Cmr1 (group 7 of RAMP superfamily)